jgi:hypothetical protein
MLLFVLSSSFATFIVVEVPLEGILPLHHLIAPVAS